MCYDSSNKITVLFGGWNQTTSLNDTWVYNYTLNQWQDITPALSPAGRSDYAVCFDYVNGRVILYGGWTNNNANYGYSGDTWALTIR